MDLGETLEELEWLRPWLTPGLDLGPVTSLDEFTGCVGQNIGLVWAAVEVAVWMLANPVDALATS